MDVAIVGVIGAILAALIGAVASIHAAKRTRKNAAPRVAIVGVRSRWVTRWDDGPPEKVLVLDFTLRNAGGQPSNHFGSTLSLFAEYAAFPAGAAGLS